MMIVAYLISRLRIISLPLSRVLTRPGLETGPTLMPRFAPHAITPRRPGLPSLSSAHSFPPIRRS